MKNRRMGIFLLRASRICEVRPRAGEFPEAYASVPGRVKITTSQAADVLALCRGGLQTVPSSLNSAALRGGATFRFPTTSQSRREGRDNTEIPPRASRPSFGRAYERRLSSA